MRGQTGEAPAATEMLLVCSAGGHLLQLWMLEAVWRSRRHAWVTLAREDSVSLLAGEPVVFAHGPTTRNVANLARNLLLAWRVVRRMRPHVLLTTGAGVAVPFAWIARLHGTKVVYVESLTRVERPSLSCRLIAPVASRLYVQWPELAPALRRAHYAGSVLASR